MLKHFFVGLLLHYWMLVAFNVSALLWKALIIIISLNYHNNADNIKESTLKYSNNRESRRDESH